MSEDETSCAGSENLRWGKSGFSSGANACVELAQVDERTIALRNSRDRGRVLYFNRAEMSAFLAGAKHGHFDEFLEG